LGRAVRAQEVKSQRVFVKRGGGAEAGAKKEIGYGDGRREAEVEKGKEVKARREEETGAKRGDEVGVEAEGGAESKGVGVGIGGWGK